MGEEQQPPAIPAQAVNGAWNLAQPKGACLTFLPAYFKTGGVKGF